MILLILNQCELFRAHSKQDLTIKSNQSIIKRHGKSKFVIMIVIGIWLQDPSTILKIYLRIYSLSSYFYEKGTQINLFRRNL